MDSFDIWTSSPLYFLKKHTKPGEGDLDFDTASKGAARVEIEENELQQFVVIWIGHRLEFENMEKPNYHNFELHEQVSLVVNITYQLYLSVNVFS